MSAPTPEYHVTLTAEQVTALTQAAATLRELVPVAPTASQGVISLTLSGLQTVLGLAGEAPKQPTKASDGQPTQS